MARPLRVYTTVVRSVHHGHNLWKTVLLVENSSGKVLSEEIHPLPPRREHGIHPVDRTEASLSAMLTALMAGRKHRAHELIVYSDCPATVDIMNRRRGANSNYVGTYLQARAMAYSYRTVSFYYSPYPAMSDLPVIAAEG